MPRPDQSQRVLHAQYEPSPDEVRGGAWPGDSPKPKPQTYWGA